MSYNKGMTRPKLTTRHGLLFALFLLIAGYSLFQARLLVIGPRIEIISYEGGTSSDSQLIVLNGIAENAAWITINDRQIFTDENGNWSEKLVASDGPSIITVKAKDRFGRETEKSIEIVLNPQT